MLQIRSSDGFGIGSVYRHLEKKWVRDFFETGNLQLTTLEKCREHDALNRADDRDGKLNFALEDGEQMLAGITTVGACSYVLCTSHSTHPQVQSRFGTDSWFEIMDVEAFANAVARTLGCTLPPKLGSCIYVDEKEVTRLAESPLALDFRELTERMLSGSPSEMELDIALRGTFARLEKRARVFEEDAYFLKSANPYRVEQEFRFVWFVDRKVTGPEVFRLDDARRYCRPTSS